MRFTKLHPCLGDWLYLEPQDYRSTYNKLIQCRDKEDSTSSGIPASFKTWVYEKQLPELITKEKYKKALAAHLEFLFKRKELLEAQKIQLAGSTIEQLSKVEEDIEKLSQYR